MLMLRSLSYKILVNKEVIMKEINDSRTQNIPIKLYRYREFGEYWKKELFEEYIHMANRHQINNPFDCMININQEKYIEYKKKKVYIDCEDKDKFEDIWKILKPKEEASIEKIKEEVRDRISIANFSEKNDDILMWSYYSKLHTGFCIEYDTSKLKNKKYLFPIQYGEQGYDFTPDIIPSNIPPTNPIWLKAFLCKPKIWEYEKEWRLIYPETNRFIEDKYNFTNSIIGVYFGVNQNIKEEWDEIKKWAKEKHINLYQMKIKEREYKLYSEEIEL